MADDDTIYVDVAPRLDDDAAEKATGRLRDKLKDGVKGAGKTIGNVLHSELAEELARSVEPLGREMGEKLAKGLGSKVGGFLHDELRDELKGVGVDLDGITDKARDLAGQWGINEDNVSKLSDAFKDFKAGDIAKSVGDLTQAFAGMPGPLGQVADKTKDLSDRFDNAKGGIKDTTSGLLDLTNNSGRIAGGLSAIEAAAGPLAATFAVLDALMPGFDQHFNNVMDQLQGKQGFNPKDWINTLVPGTNLFDKAFPGPVSGDSPIPAKPGVPLQPGPGAAPAGPPGYTTAPGSLDPFSALLPPGTQIPAGPGNSPSIAPPDTGGGAHTSSALTGGGTHASLVDYTTPSLPSVSSPSDLPAAGGGVKNLFQVAQALQGTPYSQQLRNDCSGMVSQLAAAAVGLPPPSAGQRFSTTNEGQWLSQHGFAVDQGPAPTNSFQIGWYDHGGGNQGHTAATLPGGINAESGGSVGSFTLGGGVGANSPQFEHHAYLPMGAPGAGAMPAGFGVPGGGGLPGLGAYAPPPTQGNTYTPNQKASMGHGSGVGVSGGAIGMAEQAGVMAAGVFGPAAQVAVQEANLAIQKGGQMAATAAMAPLETFGLSGGQMGAPSVSTGGWYKKIVGGLMGQQNNIANMAGASTQPPKDPKDPNQQGEQGQQGQQGQGGGPKGSQDDPMHVKVTNSPPPQQGSATSAMNTTGVMSGTTV